MVQANLASRSVLAPLTRRQRYARQKRIPKLALGDLSDSGFLTPQWSETLRKS